MSTCYTLCGDTSVYRSSDNNTMPLSDEELYRKPIAELVARYGEVPPLWARYPRAHPIDIHWRMGGGEGYKYLFQCWESSRSWTVAERIAYVTRWDPPYSWLQWVAWFLWPEDFVDLEQEVTEEHWAQLNALGLGSREDWERCFDVEPDAYPLEDDTSSRWLSDTDA
jgi:hypothetical protein